MLKKSIVIGLLCLTGQAYASITVTTTEDVVKDDNVCSLREAIYYVNNYLSDEDKKDAGYYGCGGSDATNTIYLKSNQTYTLNSEIAISAAVSIQTETSTTSTDANYIGKDNATIKASGNHRLFTIDDGDSSIAQITVTLSQVNLQGCGSSSMCEEQGGIIFNREALTIEYSKISDGYANFGGAIYSDGIISGTNKYSASAVQLDHVIMTGNSAQTGAGLYIGQPLFTIKNSVIRNNTNTDTDGVVIYSKTDFDDDTTSSSSFVNTSAVINTSLFQNTGYLINVRNGVYINNITAVDNSKGLYLEAPIVTGSTVAKAYIANSILAGNNSLDCVSSSTDSTQFYNNLVGDTCPAGETGNLNTYLSAVAKNKLFAGTSSEGSCDRPPAEGLLCPFKTPADYFIGYFKPRLLSAYTTLNDSPIVNKGRLYSDGTDEGDFSCISTDQRGFSRSDSVHCDLGSIELVVSSDNISLMGADIVYGQVATLDISDNLADGELLPADECAAVMGSTTAPDGSAWKVGCLRIEQSAATPVSKGTLTLSEDGTLVYTPNSNWHGLDQFNLRVVTTASRFSESETDRDIVIPIKIVQSPVDDFTSSKVKTSGGALGDFTVLGLILMAIRRRIKA